MEEKPTNEKSIAKRKEIEELKKQEEEAVVEPPIKLHNLPGEKEACVGSSGYNLDNLDQFILEDQPEPEQQKQDFRAKSFIKKPSLKSKKPIPEWTKLDEDLGGKLNLTKDEAERRLGEYMSSMIINKLKSQKWESKVIGVQWMQEWIITNGSHPNMIEYALRFLKGIMKDWKEVNSNLTKSASECIYNILKNTDKIGKRSIGYIIPYLSEKLTDALVKDLALESVLLCAELSFKSYNSVSYTIKQLTKYGPKTVNQLVLKEIYSCILLIFDSFGVEGIHLDKIFEFIIFGCAHKAAEVRNEAIIVIKQLYTIYGYGILGYLKDIKPSTMSVITQELDTIDLPEHLKVRKDEIKVNDEVDDELLASPNKREKDEEEEEDKDDNEYNISPLRGQDEEYRMSRRSIDDDTKSVMSKSSKMSTDSKSKLRGSINQPRKASKSSKFVVEVESKKLLEIFDIGNKEVRDKKDVKIIWSPNELRSDIVQKIQSQIKSAFGSSIESKCFSSNFNLHIECLKMFETWFEPDFPHINEFFCIIDLILKWIFIKGWEGSNTNTKFLIEIINFWDSLVDFLDSQAYELMEGEGIILITFLVEKANNSNTSIRESINNLIMKIASNESFYPLKASFKLIMNGASGKNAKIKKEWLDIITSLIEEMQQELFDSKDIKAIIKEVDSKDKFTRSSALDAWIAIYKMVGDEFWNIAGKGVNQKVKDLIQSKISNIPQNTKLVKKPPKVPKVESTKEETKSNLVRPSSKGKKTFQRGKIATPSKIPAASQSLGDSVQKRK